MAPVESRDCIVLNSDTRDNHITNNGMECESGGLDSGGLDSGGLSSGQLNSRPAQLLSRQTISKSIKEAFF